MQRSFRSFVKNKKERKDNSVFFYKEWKITQERCVLLKRMEAQPCKMVAGSFFQKAAGARLVHLKYEY